MRLTVQTVDQWTLTGRREVIGILDRTATEFAGSYGWDWDEAIEDGWGPTQFLPLAWDGESRFLLVAFPAFPDGGITVEAAATENPAAARADLVAELQVTGDVFRTIIEGKAAFNREGAAAHASAASPSGDAGVAWRSARRVELSDTTVQHGVFSALADLIFLGVARDAATLEIGAILTLLLEKESDQFLRTAMAAAVAAGVEIEMPELWREKADGLPALAESADGWLVFLSGGRWVPGTDIDGDSRGRLVAHAVERRLRDLLAEVIFGAVRRHGFDAMHAATVRDVTIDAAKLANVRRPAEAAARAYVVWSVTTLERLLDRRSHATDEARVDLRAAALELDAAFRPAI